VHFLEGLLKHSSRSASLMVEGRETPLATTVETAFDSASRKKGLLGRDALPEGTALVIAPCSAVHTFSMRFPIDVIFARRDGKVLKVRANMVTGRMTAAFGAFAVIEMCAGAAERANVRVGDHLVVR
jgi:uncharacterized membrane protein (UPF0127 family)